MRSECPVCSSKESHSFFESAPMPVQASELIYDRAAALTAPLASIELVACPGCGLIYNRKFDPALVTYDDSYDNALHFSPRFQEYQSDLVDRLVDRYRLNGRRILEVGCGDGEFLCRLCEKGHNSGIGFDPACGHRVTPEGVELIAEYYSPSAVAGKCEDFVCCRHVLEHVDAPLDFLRSIRDGTGSASSVPAYFEVPNSQRMLEQGALWELIYEHFSYYTPASLGALLQRAGFEIESLTEEYEGQFLSAFTEADCSKECAAFLPANADTQDLMATFGELANRRLSSWQDTVQRLLDDGRQTAVWGAGAKGVTFLNLVPAARHIETVIDVNPRKHESFVPGSGHRVTGPAELQKAPPDTVLLMNGIYYEEVQRSLSDLGVNAELIVA
ncbi:MAG TPA: class I SAM-dependent methyltransferase [Dehalococcoidia bacterium]|nr:class I SAM-dependent methyltransferase [Dehalococcoidia bacterium]